MPQVGAWFACLNCRRVEWTEDPPELYCRDCIMPLKVEAARLASEQLEQALKDSRSFIDSFAKKGMSPFSGPNGTIYVGMAPGTKVAAQTEWKLVFDDSPLMERYRKADEDRAERQAKAAKDRGRLQRKGSKAPRTGRR